MTPGKVARRSGARKARGQGPRQGTRRIRQTLRRRSIRSPSRGAASTAARTRTGRGASRGARNARQAGRAACGPPARLRRADTADCRTGLAAEPRLGLTGRIVGRGVRMGAADRWQHLQQLFDQLVAMDPSRREAWLAEHEPDPDLRGEALALVGAHDSSEGGFTARVGELAGNAFEPAAREGMRIGPYLLRGEIGSGGMGTVFLAERIDAEYEQKVAIKLIRGVATADASQRLRRERQILADLTHPNIARLLDGGTTESGQPYLVMEYVEGTGITQFARERKLARAQRLRLLQQVARAVQYAHQRLVVHRDLKPANVLVRADGTPVLLDFGIAKLLDVDATGPHETQTGLPWFTPAYASPEQRIGRAVSTASDIYGLGALLHELLSDEVPAPDREGRLPPPTMLRNGAGERAGDRELDIIVGKAAHPDPDRRYASAEALANDIERYLRGRPIQAAPDSVGYRVRKFVRRNPFASAAVVVAAVLCVAFVWRLALENERARLAEERAQRESVTSGRVVDYMVALFDQASPEKVGLRPISAEELVDAGLRDLGTQLDQQPQPKARLLAAISEIYAKLGRNEKGIDAMEQAVALQRPLGDDAWLSRYLQLYGNMLNASGRFPAAIAALDEGIALQDREGARDLQLLAEMLTTRSLAHSRSGDVEKAIADARRAAELGQLSAAKSTTLVGEANNALSEAYLVSNDNARAVAIARDNVRELEARPDAGNTLFGAREYLAAALSANGELVEAEALLRRQLVERGKTVDPNSDWFITLRNQLGAIVRNLGKPLEAVALLRENVEAMRARGMTATPSYMIALNNLGSLEEHVGDYAASEALLRDALRLALAEDDPGSLRPDIYRQNLGRVLLLAGRYDEALPLIEHEVADDGSNDRRITRLRRLVHLAEWNRMNRRLESAADFIEQAQRNLLGNFGADHPRAGAVLRARALLERDRGELVDAETHLREAMVATARAAAPESNPMVELRLELADVLLRAGKRDEARTLVEQTRASLAANFSPAAPARALHAKLARELGIATTARPL
ncbi:MAG: serine/threonine protein kinase [Lysobacteraceae bacterium]|nr:MAG: serine/threonine protein kinase [Xanthomonadaceae bacterium]